MSKRTVELELATPGLDAQGQPVRVPLGIANDPRATDPSPPEPDLAGEHMLINIGPQHPATHGVLRLVVELDGRSEERRVGEECRSRWSADHLKKNRLYTLILHHNEDY